MRRHSILAGLLLAACSDPLTWEEAGEKMRLAMYQNWISCGFAEAEYTEAHESQSLSLADAQDAIRAALEDGRLHLDKNALDECLEAYERPECQQTPAACFQIVAGDAAEGQRCFLPLECQDGLFCNASDEVCPGTCQPAKGAGERAASAEQCRPDLCFQAQESRCVACAEEGQSCLEGPCRQGLRCDDGTCRGPGGLGVACSRFTDYCQFGLVCSQGVCAARVGIGEACTNLDARCRAGSSCVEGTCRLDPKEGEQCQLSCLPGLFCQSPIADEPATCVRVPKAGESCRAALTCTFGAYCDRSTTNCVPFKKAGEACTDSLECGITNCVGGSCAPLLKCMGPT